MNQDILFPDLQEWQSAQQRICFPAQMMGALIQCYISKGQLERMAGLVLRSEDDALRAFSSLRFDIEELATQAIEEQAFAPDGSITIGQWAHGHHGDL